MECFSNHFLLRYKFTVHLFIDGVSQSLNRCRRRCDTRAP